jgi:hypothetical protein
MNKYAPTQNPGDTRTRARYIGIWNPLVGQPTIDILEQQVVRLADGERVLADTPGITGIPFDPAEVVELRHPETDEMLGQTTTAGAIMAGVYSWCRGRQERRDAAGEDSTNDPA